MRGLRRQFFRWLLPVSSIELRKIPRHALFQLGAVSLHLPTREVLVAGIDGLKLAAVDRDARIREQTHQAAQFDKLHADLLDRWSTVLAEVGNSLVVRNEPAQHMLKYAWAALVWPRRALTSIATITSSMRK